MNSQILLIVLGAVQILVLIGGSIAVAILVKRLRNPANLTRMVSSLIQLPPPTVANSDKAAYEERGRALARMAVGHASQVGEEGTPEERLQHALSAFRLFDQADNGKRDYQDNLARVLIEAAVAETKSAKTADLQLVKPQTDLQTP
jgi:hypothetical protein